MIKRDYLKQPIRKQIKELRMHWQMYFLPAALFYGLAVWHLLSIHPSVKPEMAAYVKNIDLGGFIIAILMAVVILQIKRQFFSLRFARTFVAEAIQHQADISDGDVVRNIFRVWKAKFSTVWLLGMLIILVGVASYWLTFSPAINFHIYFVIGSFSMVINFPRQDLFIDLPWQIAEARRDKDAAERTALEKNEE